MWVGLIQPVEGRKRKKTLYYPRKRESFALELQHFPPENPKTQTSSAPASRHLVTVPKNKKHEVILVKLLSRTKDEEGKWDNNPKKRKGTNILHLSTTL